MYNTKAMLYNKMKNKYMCFMCAVREVIEADSEGCRAVNIVFNNPVREHMKESDLKCYRCGTEL